MTTNKDNSHFVDNVLDTRSLLDSSVSWIAEHLSPDDVFSSNTLHEWATDNGYVQHES